MSGSTVTLNNLMIETHLSEIAEDNGRFIQLGSGAVWERWSCDADHGSGPCHEPLLTQGQAATLVGQPVVFCLDSPAMAPIKVTVLGAEFGFQLSELYHLSDVVAEFRKAQD
ncbi:hypothetical protein ABZT48_05340 [Streptomyces avermitilis]|uniref:hypothetical protein n=1 Tax=Streptomyces avermitilis TaxID=33903 RepID=UPI0033BB6D5B